MKLKTAFSAQIILAGLILATNCFSSIAHAQVPNAAQPAAATQPAAAAGGHLIAVVDVGLIFNEHPRFSGQIKQMQAEAKAAQEQYNNLMNQLATEAKKADPKNPDYRKVSEDLVRRKTELEISRSKMIKDLQDREGKMFLSFYKEVSSIIDAVVTRNNIAMVIRYNNIKINPNDPNDIMRGISKPILYADPRWDITKMIKDSIPSVAAAPGGNAFQR